MRWAAARSVSSPTIPNMGVLLACAEGTQKCKSLGCCIPCCAGNSAFRRGMHESRLVTFSIARTMVCESCQIVHRHATSLSVNRSGMESPCAAGRSDTVMPHTSPGHRSIPAFLRLYAQAISSRRTGRTSYSLNRTAGRLGCEGAACVLCAASNQSCSSARSRRIPVEHGSDA